MSLTELRLKEATDRIVFGLKTSHPTFVPALQAIAQQQIEAVQKALKTHIDKAQVIKANDRYSDKAKQEDLADLQALTKKNLASIIDQSGLEANAKRIEAELVNQLVRTRKRYVTGRDPMEAMLDRLDQREARAEARREREEARALHRAKLESAKRNKEVLSDAERVFIDPVADRFLAACREYTAEKEAYISALESPPFGVQLLTPETIDQGRDLIKQVICADLIEAQAAAQVRLEQAQVMATIAGEALHTFPAKQEERPFMSDQERRQATA